MRHEHKFLVPVEAAARVREVVQHYCDVDPYALGRPGNHYTVRSIYLDSPRATIYTHKVEGLRSRVKVRVRGYDDVDAASTVGLELKRKRGDLSWKVRARCSLKDTARWLALPSSDPAAEGLFRPDQVAAADQFHFVVTRFMLRPVNVVTYEREPYVGRHDPTLRVTLDSDLRGRLVQSVMDLGRDCPYTVFHRHFILEVKFDYHFPSWLRPLLAEIGLKRRALSKYVLALDESARREHRPVSQVFERLRCKGTSRGADTVASRTTHHEPVLP